MNLPIRITGCALTLLLFLPPLAAAQQPTAEQQTAIRAACRADFMVHCRGVSPGGAAALACLKDNAAKISSACQKALASLAGAATPASASPTAGGSLTSDTAAWPHTFRGDTGIATVYQPQVISWPEQHTLNTRIAIGITPNAAKEAALGTVEVAFKTQSDPATRTVILTEPVLKSSRFPTMDTAQAALIEEKIKAALAGIGVKRVPLDTILLSLQHDTQTPPPVALNDAPPQIFVSARTSSLVVFDGKPIMTPVTGTSLTVAVNTNWDVFQDSASGKWYLLNNGAWLSAPVVEGPWAPAGTLPVALSALPGDANFSKIKQQIPGRPLTPKDVPTVFVSTSPAAIIATSGPPQFVAIPGTGLQYVANTDAAVFKDVTSGRFYYLLSGRWFAAAGLDGPWTFATNTLPADFARIPPDSPRGFVLVSVPGTAAAQQALIEAQIPQEGTLDRSSAKITVVYAGEPKFEPITGTTMLYAANTAYAVINVGDTYYAAWQGAWFTAPTPNGPWVLAASVPQIIYTIPPASPLYPVTYLTVVASTPTTVSYSYTSGYTMSYVSAGVVVYGTGYYYPPYYYPAPIPIYYPYPYSYAGATYYNSTTGAWAHGGAIYGPYGGVAKGGTAYNPTTGAWASGGAIYGPNGGAGAFSAYNPSTGSYAHGSAAWGPDGGSANANWYNANTGRSGATQQNSNAYGRWGSSTIAGPNQTLHTQSQSNAQGSTGSFSSSSGAKGAGASGAGGNRGGVVQTSGGDVYAGADGNVYKKTDSGWQKYDNGSWNNVQKPTSTQTQRTGASSAQRTAPTSSPAASGGERSNTAATSEGTRPQDRFGAGGGSEGFQQLEQDRSARLGGSQRQQQFQSARGGFAGRAGAGGGFRR